MKNCRLVAVIALLYSLSTQAQEGFPRKIVVTCPSDHPPTMNDIRLAIEHSDYTVTLRARLQMLAHTREVCASRPSAVLAFVSPDEAKSEPEQRMVSK